MTSDAKVLSGGGEMGALMRTIDWAKTPVGPVARWPQSLRTALSILLETGFPMYIAWGREFTQFYNDGYRPILGSTKHPAAMGISTRETFAEIWDIIGPMFAGVMQGTPVTVTDFMLPLDRHGFVEECYFVFSYSPIREESGDVGGVLVTVTETTDRVLGARRMKTLQQLALQPKSLREAYEKSLAVLAENLADVPFASLRVDGAPAASFGEPKGKSTELFIAPGVRLIAGLSDKLVFDSKYQSFLELVGGQIATSIATARALEEAQARAEALAEIDRAKTAFFSNVSHELRTPLTLLLGPAQDALSGPLAPEERQRWELVQRNGERLLRLVNTLLDFSRIEAGRVQAAFEPVDLAALTEDLVSVFRSAIESAGLRLVLALEPLEGRVFVDREMWEKIVLNLLSNALKFTFAGEIRVRLARREGRAVLQVEDTGGGIPPGELARVFERFHRVQGARSRTHEGTGIGLALVQELVKLHHGEVSVSSELGRGTEFTVSLPLGSAHLPHSGPREAAPAGQREPAAPSGPREAAPAGQREPAAPSERREPAAPSERREPAAPSGQREPAHARQHEAARAAAAEALRWGAQVRDLPGIAPAGEARILIADDNADMRDYLQRLLAPRYRVEVAVDGEDALLRIGRALPDLVLSDVMMPRLDGFGLLARLRNDERWASIPVVLLSARAGEEAQLEGRKAGADDYLVKPFSAKELLARVESQLALAKLRKLDQRHREELKRLFMGAPVFICLLRGPNHVFELTNDAYVRVVGREVAGKPVVEALPEVVEQGFIQLLDRVYQTGEPYVGNEVPVQLGGQDKFVTFTYEPFRDADGRIDGIAVFGFDVTEMVLARRRTEALAEQALAADRRKDEFLAMLGHELRNPLAPIATAVKLMELKGDQTSKRERAVIERQVTHLARLVDDLLDVARIAQGKIELARQPLDVAEVAAKAVEMASPLFENHAHTLDIEVPRGELFIDGDPVRLSQVIGNLLTNAARYTPPRGHVTLSAQRGPHDCVRICVRDNGIGIAAEFLPRIFDLFVQGPRGIDRREGGLGLGLSLVKNLVAAHGGKVTARSEGPGRGSEFAVELPLLHGARAESSPAAEAAGKPRAGKRVLVVDDNADAAEVLAETLFTLGHDVQVAHDGAEALKLLERFPAEVGVLDLGLPIMDGYELASRIRGLSRAPLRLIAVTGYGQEDDRRRTSEAGFDAHLVKPIAVDELDTLISLLPR